MLDGTIAFIFETPCSGTFVEAIFGILTDALEDLDALDALVGVDWPTAVGARRIGPMGARLASVPILSVIPFSALIFVYDK